MSHRKFHAPRHGSMGFSPRKRTRYFSGRIKRFPPDNPKLEPHLTAFMGFKAGMTKILREVKRPGSKLDKKEVVEPVTIIETPPMVVCGITGYCKTPAGMKCVGTVWAAHLDNAFKRRIQRNWYKKSKRNAFSTYQKQFKDEGDAEAPEEVRLRIQKLKMRARIIRVVCHTQPTLVPKLRTKKAHIFEVQVNGGTINDKVKFAQTLLEKKVAVNTIFKPEDLIDVIASTKGHGTEGVTHRWGVTRLPRKTHRGLRKVACIGAWHPARVATTVARVGQNGFHHRTEHNKKIYRIGEAVKYGENGEPTTWNANTEADLTKKNITPLGGFVRYGVVRNDFIMVKGTTPGVRRRPTILRKSLHPSRHPQLREPVNLKWIDTASQFGNNNWQTSKEKYAFLGDSKKMRLQKAETVASRRKIDAKKRKEAAQRQREKILNMAGK